MSDDVIFILLGFLGLIIHILFKLQARKDKDTKFSVKYWFVDNWIEVSLSIVSIISLLLMREELFDFLGIIPKKDSGTFMRLTAFLSGIFNTELIRTLKKIVTTTNTKS